VSLESKPSVLETGASRKLFPMRTVFVSERNSSHKSEFARWREALFALDKPILLS
jgi:hypothetical protein